MALIKSVRGFEPTWGSNCFLAENATIIGDVQMGDFCSVWFQAVVRGDVNKIRIGNRVNIQDGSIIHATYKKSETHISDNVSIGHRAIVHGCRIEENVLIGMGAIIMDHAVVEENCIIAAGALIPEGRICKSGNIYAGVPARVLKPLTSSMLHTEIERIANSYLTYSSWYSDQP